MRFIRWQPENLSSAGADAPINRHVVCDAKRITPGASAERAVDCGGSLLQNAPPPNENPSKEVQAPSKEFRRPDT